MMYNYLKNSGLSIRIHVNPFMWAWKPYFSAMHDSVMIELNYAYRGYTFGWLAFGFHAWIDNGEPGAAIFDEEDDNDK